MPTETIQQNTITEANKRDKQEDTTQDQQPNTRAENVDNKDMQSVTVRLIDGTVDYGTFFIAPRPYEIMEVTAVWTTASTSGTLQVERLQGTTAEGAGDDILKTTIDTSGTADTVVTRKTYTDLQNRSLDIGDRLALVSGGTLTGLVNLVVTILYKPSGRGDYR